MWGRLSRLHAHSFDSDFDDAKEPLSVGGKVNPFSSVCAVRPPCFFEASCSHEVENDTVRLTVTDGILRHLPVNLLDAARLGKSAGDVTGVRGGEEAEGVCLCAPV